MPADLLRYTSIRLRHLRLVHAVAETGSLTQAARRLRLTTSALSHQLRQLETLAGTRVFERRSKSMRPTDAGRALLEASARALPAILDAHERLANGSAAESPTVRLCAHCFTGYQWLPPLLQELRRRKSRIDINIVPEATRRPFEAMVEGELDLVLTFDPPVSGAFAVHPLFRDELVLLIPADHRLRKATFVDLAELAEEHLILYSSTLEASHFVRTRLFPKSIRPKRFTSITLTE